MGPYEVGMAAAYEVWRNWRHHHVILAQPLSHNVARQREALVGLAVGEAASLWQYTHRVDDTAGYAAAVQAAVTCVTRIFDQSKDAPESSNGTSASQDANLNLRAVSPSAELEKYATHQDTRLSALRHPFLFTTSLV